MSKPIHDGTQETTVREYALKQHGRWDRRAAQQPLAEIHRLERQGLNLELKLEQMKRTHRSGGSEDSLRAVVGRGRKRENESWDRRGGAPTQ